MRTFSFGVLITSSFGSEGVVPSLLSSLATRIAGLGADGLFVRTSTANAVEPVTALSSIASSNDLVLGAVISLESGRNPAIVTKMATTLALLAPGRAALILTSDGIEDELRLVEALEVAGSLRGEGPLSAGGTEFFVRDAYNEPRPPLAAALGLGVIVPAATSRLISASDLVIVDADAGSRVADEPSVVPLFHERVPGECLSAPFILHVDGASIDHVADVVAEVAARRN